MNPWKRELTFGVCIGEPSWLVKRGRPAVAYRKTCMTYGLDRKKNIFSKLSLNFNTTTTTTNNNPTITKGKKTSSHS